VKFIEAVEEGGCAPRGYGLAWRSFYKAEIYFAPIPFHLFIGWGRRLWHRYRYPKYGELGTAELLANLSGAREELRFRRMLQENAEKESRAAFAAGFERGLAEGPSE